jgi:TnpA family transposase
MPRRSILTAAERENLLGWPESQAELIRHYTISATDLAIIRQHRGAANRLGYAVQLCSMRFPGVALGVREKPFSPLLQMVADQLSKTGASTGIARKHGGACTRAPSNLRI